MTGIRATPDWPRHGRSGRPQRLDPGPARAARAVGRLFFHPYFLPVELYHLLYQSQALSDFGEAEQPAMPTNALALVTPDYIVPLARLGLLLVRLTTLMAPASLRWPAPALDVGWGGRAT